MRSQLTVILADDDKDDCFLFSEAIEELKIPVHLSMVYDGAELMKNLKDESIDLPDALFLDLNMPKKNGVECLAEIKDHPKLQDLSVIIFSTSYDPRIADQLYKAGAKYYMRKPSDFSILKKLIHEVLIRIDEAPFARIPQKDFLLTFNPKDI